jgi:hypothetical protein
VTLFTSPCVRGEVGAKRRVRGTFRNLILWRLPLTLTLSPHAGRGNSHPNNTASAPFTASAESQTVRSSEAACTVMFSAKKRASVT